MNPSTGARPWVIVFGGSSGIGLDTARRFLQYGYSVLLVARGVEALRAATDTLRADAATATVESYACDVSKAEAVIALRAHMLSLGRVIAGVVVSSGRMQACTLADMPLGDLEAMIDTNLKGCLYVGKYLADTIRDRGFLVFVSSLAAVQGIYGYTVYAASKAALGALAEALEHELAARGIRLKVVCPPDTDTPGLKKEDETRPELTRKLSGAAALLPAGRVADTIVHNVGNGGLYLWPSWSSYFVALLKRAVPWLVRAILASAVAKHNRAERTAARAVPTVRRG